LVRSTPYHGDMAQNTVRGAPVDVVGSRPAPSAFQAPRVTPLETPSLPANPAAGKPSVAPRGYQGGDYRPLAELIPRRRGHREPHDPFSTQAGLTGPRVEHRDPHEPIRTSRLASSSSTWAAPAGDPVSTVPPPRLKTVRMPRRLDPRMPATAGSRSIMDLCRALGWPWIVVLALGCVWSPLSIPALLLAWWLAWRHPFAAGRLSKALTAVTVVIIIGGAIESPVRTVPAQFAWMSRLGCVVMLALGLLLIDRQLTPRDPRPRR